MGLKKNIERLSSARRRGFSASTDIPREWLRIPVRKTEAARRIDWMLVIVRAAFVVIIVRLLGLSLNFDFLKGGRESRAPSAAGFSRPDITDRNGEPLAVSLPTFDLYVNQNEKEVVAAEDSAVKLVAIMPELDYAEVLSKLRSKKFAYLKRQVAPHVKEKILAIGEPGLQFQARDSRVYPQDKLFAHIVGTTDVDNRGTGGIEMYIDAKGLAAAGGQVRLSVDLYIQNALHQNLSAAMREYGAKSAAGIVMDVKTGEVLGLVSLPDFWGAEAAKVAKNPLYSNHATLDTYEIGSVMKIFNTALAMESRYPEGKTFDVSRPFAIGGFRVRDSHVRKNRINMREAFVFSSNIASATIARDLGMARQTEFFRRMNFFSRMGFELPECGMPMFPKRWNDVINATAAYGYGISVSLLHTIVAVNAIINDGMYVEPTILLRDRDSLFKSYQVVREETSAKMKELMKLVVTEGTGLRASLSSIKTGGKTGTAHKLVDGRYDVRRQRTFFVSVFPIDRPKYTMLVMLDEAANGTCNDAACTAVPVSAKIVEDIGPILNLDLK
ncbi:MAG: penicillin-binding protein 2 [Rickettsiales bacterium]|nr:penicillin-binding protein 2 [Rickettsiales bacterium]